MQDYAKRSQRWEEEIEDVPSESTAAPTLDAANLHAHEELTRQRALRKLSSTAVEAARILLKFRKNGTRTAATTQTEIAEVLGVSLRTASRIVAEWKGAGIIEVSRRGRKQSYYTFCISALPDYILDAPRPERIPPKGPLLGNDKPLSFPAGGFDTPKMAHRTDTDTPKMAHQTGADTPKLAHRTTPHKENAQPRARESVRKTDSNKNPLGDHCLADCLEARPNFRDPSPEGLNEEEIEILEALWEFDQSVDEDGARKLATDARKRGPDLTTEEICHFIRQQGEANKHNPKIRRQGGVLIGSVPKLCGGHSLRQFREKKQQQQQVLLGFQKGDGHGLNKVEQQIANYEAARAKGPISGRNV